MQRYVLSECRLWQNPDQKANRGFVEAVIAEFKFTNSDNRRIYCDDYSAILLTFVRRSRLCNKYNRNLPTANVVLFFHRLQFR